MQAVMEKRPATTGGLYLYAIAEGNGQSFDALTGIADQPLTLCSNGRICAIVSEAPPGRIRPERRNLAAHQEVLRRLMEHQTVLPVAFGVVADDMPSLDRILNTNETLFREQLSSVRGRVEMSVRLSWSVPNIFEYFLNKHPQLLEARDSLLVGTPTQEQKMAVGRLFEQLLVQDREAHSERVEKGLETVCASIRQSALRNEQEVANLACLVERTRLTEFEAALMETARGFDENFAFNLSGPWAPHNFVEMSISV